MSVKMPEVKKLAKWEVDEHVRAVYIAAQLEKVLQFLHEQRADGDRQFVKVLGAVPGDGLAAVEAAHGIM